VLKTRRVREPELACKNWLLSFRIIADRHPPNPIAIDNQYSSVRLMLRHDFWRLIIALEVKFGISEKNIIFGPSAGNSNHEVRIEAAPIRHKNVDGPRSPKLVSMPPSYNSVCIVIQKLSKWPLPSIQSHRYHAVSIARRLREWLKCSNFRGQLRCFYHCSMLGVSGLLCFEKQFRLRCQYDIKEVRYTRGLVGLALKILSVFTSMVRAVPTGRKVRLLQEDEVSGSTKRILEY